MARVYQHRARYGRNVEATNADSNTGSRRSWGRTLVYTGAVALCAAVGACIALATDPDTRHEMKFQFLHLLSALPLRNEHSLQVRQQLAQHNCTTFYAAGMIPAPRAELPGWQPSDDDKSACYLWPTSPRN